MFGAADPADGRMMHYSAFYGLADLPAGGFGMVAGNCQAESLRIMLDGGDLPWVRMPAIHEIVASDLPFLSRMLGLAAALVSQPIRQGYRSLPIGTRDLVAALPPSTPTVIVPVIRFAGLYPHHVLVRPPAEPDLSPPVVAYHDLRTLAEAADRLHGVTTRLHTTTPELVLAAGERSQQELRSREERHGAVPVSDLFERPAFDQMRTINHPGNAVFRTLATRVRDALGLAAHEVDPGRELLDSVHAPRSAVVAEAYGLPDPARPDWLVGGEPVPEAEVRDAHLRWYAQHPEVVEAGIARHAPALEAMGFTR
jgi:hypothetical protein